jgi:hypothetical protein
MSANVRTAVVSQFQQVAREQNRKLVTLSDDLPLMNSGLDSLCFAIVVARLADSLGTDPFGATSDTQFPVTIGDFIELYEAGQG